jgi:hypothetical protein
VSSKEKGRSIRRRKKESVEFGELNREDGVSIVSICMPFGFLQLVLFIVHRLCLRNVNI